MNFHSEPLSAPQPISNHTVLPYWMCFFLNSENGSTTFKTSTSDKNVTVYNCKLKIRYLLDEECKLGESFIPCGYWICVAVSAIIIILANFGVITNILNLLILPKSLRGCSVKRLMVLLAVFDLLNSICAIPATLSLLFIVGRYQRGWLALESFRVSHLLFSLGRTGSIFVTIMITIERYIAVAFPLQKWLSPKRGRIPLIVVMLIIIIVNLPWWINKRLERNESYRESEELSVANFTSDLSEFPYIYKGTYFSRKVYPKFVVFHLFIDFAFPFPFLLIFNGLLYRSIYLSNKARQTLTTSQRKEINAAKMFSIVAFILLLCHTLAVVIFVLTQVHRVQFRELQFFLMLATTLNASINFSVYYAFGKSFRDEFWTLIYACKLFRNKVEMATVTPVSSTNGTIEMGAPSSKTQSSRNLVNAN